MDRQQSIGGHRNSMLRQVRTLSTSDPIISCHPKADEWSEREVTQEYKSSAGIPVAVRHELQVRTETRCTTWRRDEVFC